jgi:hypothetical protein
MTVSWVNNDDTSTTEVTQLDWDVKGITAEQTKILTIPASLNTANKTMKILSQDSR